MLSSQDSRNPPGAILGKCGNCASDFFNQPRIECLLRSLACFGRVIDIRPVIAKHGANLAQAGPNPVFEKLALQGQDSVSSEVPHRAFAFFNIAFST